MSTEEVDKFYEVEQAVKSLKKTVLKKKTKNKDVFLAQLDDLRLRIAFIESNGFSPD